MSIETCRITELHPGVYYTALPFCSSRLLPYLVADTTGYLLCLGHRTGNYTWRPYDLPLNTEGVRANVLSRSISFDFLLPTGQLLSLLPSLRPAIHALHLHAQPPDHLDLHVIKGKARYSLLREIGWSFEFETPGNDFGQLSAPSRAFLEAFLRHPSLSFTDLP